MLFPANKELWLASHSILDNSAQRFRFSLLACLAELARQLGKQIQVSRVCQ